MTQRRSRTDRIPRVLLLVPSLTALPACAANWKTSFLENLLAQQHGADDKPLADQFHMSATKYVQYWIQPESKVDPVFP